MVGRDGPHQEIVAESAGSSDAALSPAVASSPPWPLDGARPESSPSGPSGSSSSRASSNAGCSKRPSGRSGPSGGIQLSPSAGARPFTSASGSSGAA